MQQHRFLCRAAVHAAAARGGGGECYSSTGRSWRGGAHPRVVKRSPLWRTWRACRVCARQGGRRPLPAAEEWGRRRRTPRTVVGFVRHGGPGESVAGRLRGGARRCGSVVGGRRGGGIDAGRRYRWSGPCCLLPLTPPPLPGRLPGRRPPPSTLLQRAPSTAALWVVDCVARLVLLPSDRRLARWLCATRGAIALEGDAVCVGSARRSLFRRSERLSLAGCARIPLRPRQRSGTGSLCHLCCWLCG